MPGGRGGRAAVRPSRSIFSLFRDAKIPVVLIGGETSPDFPCDSVGVNFLGRNGKRTKARLAGGRVGGRAGACPSLISHGELVGDMAFKLMLQRLDYARTSKGDIDYRRHPPCELYLDIPEDCGRDKSQPVNLRHKKEKRKWCAK